METATIFFVDDDIKACELMLRFSENANFHTQVFQSPREALSAFQLKAADLVVSDLRMPEMSGIELLAEIRKRDKNVPFIIISAFANIDNAIEAIRLGATDLLKKPFDLDELRLLIEKTLGHHALLAENKQLKSQLKKKLNDEQQRYGMVGTSKAIQKIYSLIEKISDIRCNVMIEGESGTGKELAARAIHFHSQFKEQPFLVIDCGALTDTLLESELFGYEKGAFTGAHKNKIGLLETASGGTIFLDEIGNISDAMQNKLLRVIQEQTITRVGGVEPIKIDVRFIVATNRDIENMVVNGTFREDLFHRINVVRLHMPALRERREDIPLLVQQFIEHYAAHYNRSVKEFDSASTKMLLQHDWPGNIRELQNLVERNIALADTDIISLDKVTSIRSLDQIDSDLPTLAELEHRYILKVLNRFDQSREKTAQVLDINKSTLWRKLQQFHSAKNNIK
jgi:DNA-binding NtrC family response regulator